MLCLYWSLHFGTEENIFLLLTNTSKVPSSFTLPQYGTNLSVALSMLAYSESLNVKILVLSCLLVSVMSPIILTFSKLYSFVVQNFAPTEETLNSSVFAFPRRFLLSFTGSAASLAISFSKITALFSFIARIPFLFFDVNDTATLSVFSGSAIPKSIFFALLSNQPFLTMNGFMLSNSLALVVSTRNMFGMPFSLSMPVDVLNTPGDSFSRIFELSSAAASSFSFTIFSLSAVGRNTI